MKAIGALTLALILTITLVACRSGGSNNPKTLAPAVVDSGLRVSIPSAVRQGRDLWLDVRIESANPSQPNIWVLGGGGEFMGFLFADDYQSTGIRYNEQNQEGSFLAPIAAHPLPSNAIESPLATPDWIGYDLTVPFVVTSQPGSKITLTINHIRFNGPQDAQSEIKVISGDWSFSFVLPNNLPTPTPTPTMPTK